VIDKIAALDGESFHLAIDRFFGGTPAGHGQVIDISALPGAVMGVRIGG
jgi:hypothetical protein